MEEDDMDFNPSTKTSSNLATLFEFTKQPLKGNSSLTYTAPKAPKRESSPAKKQSEEKPKWKIIFSNTVRAYELKNNAYFDHGSIGVVITGDHDSHSYEIILYDSTKEYLSQIKISSSFSITLTSSNYVSFYDNSKQNWSVRFPTSEDVEQFSQKVVICKFYSQTEPPAEILIQDLGISSGEPCSQFSIVDVVYNMYILFPEELTRVRSDIKEKIKLCDYYFSHLSKGLIGSKENCKRIIIIPRLLNRSTLDELCAKKDLLIEAKIEKISLDEEAARKEHNKSLKEISTDKNSNIMDCNKLSYFPENSMFESTLPGQKPPESPIDASAEETRIKTREASIRESSSSTKSEKANLISRMARMGQATLPVKQGIFAGPSASEEKGSVTSTFKPLFPRNGNTMASSPMKNLIIPTQNAETLQQLPMHQNNLSLEQKQLGKLDVSYQQLMPVSANLISSPSADSNLSVYTSEARMHAAEFRMGLSKISEKLDLVWNKIQNMSEAETGKKIYPANSGGFLLSIQNLFKENESLKKEIEEQKSKVEQQNDRIYHLLELNHKYLEQNSTAHEKQSENELRLKAEMESLQRKELEMEAINKTALDRVKNLEEDLAKSEKHNKELSKKIEELKLEAEELKRVTEKSSDNAKESESLKEKVWKASETIIKLREKIKEVISENQNLKSVIQSQKEEIETGSQELKDSRTRNQEYEKSMESLKKLISEKESETENLSKLIAKLEEDNKSLVERIESEKATFASENAANETVKFDKRTESQETETLSVEPTIVPAPRTNFQNQEVLQKEKEEEGTPAEPEKKQSSPLKEPEKKDERREAEDSKTKDEVDSRYKSYDQGWRTAKPPPPPLFDDEDEDNDWLDRKLIF